MVRIKSSKLNSPDLRHSESLPGPRSRRPGEDRQTGSDGGAAHDLRSLGHGRSSNRCFGCGRLASSGGGRVRMSCPKCDDESFRSRYSCNARSESAKGCSGLGRRTGRSRAGRSRSKWCTIPSVFRRFQSYYSWWSAGHAADAAFAARTSAAGYRLIDRWCRSFPSSFGHCRSF